MGRRLERAWAAQRRLGEVGKAAFLAALRQGASLKESARAAGFALATFYRARGRDPVFAAAWNESAAASPPQRIVAPGNRRRLQSRKHLSFRFTDERKQIFLGRFAGTCNLAEAAEVAGVCESTVARHLAKDGAFRSAFDEAMEQGYVRLEAEALHQRLIAQRRLREESVPTGEVAAEFERVMKLLARWDRRGGQAGRRTVAAAHRQGATFDEAIDALLQRLKHLDIPLLRLPPPGAAADESEAQDRGGRPDS